MRKGLTQMSNSSDTKSQSVNSDTGSDGDQIPWPQMIKGPGDPSGTTSYKKSPALLGESRGIL